MVLPLLLPRSAALVMPAIRMVNVRAFGRTWDDGSYRLRTTTASKEGGKRHRCVSERGQPHSSMEGEAVDGSAMTSTHP